MFLKQSLIFKFSLSKLSELLISGKQNRKTFNIIHIFSCVKEIMVYGTIVFVSVSQRENQSYSTLPL